MRDATFRAATALGLLLAALVPLLVPGALLLPALRFVTRLELQLTAEHRVVTATEQSWGVFGARGKVSYGPILEADTEEMDAVQDAGGTPPGRVLAALALRTPHGPHRPFAAFRTDGAPGTQAAAAIDVGMMAQRIESFIRRPRPEPLVLERAQSFPTMLAEYAVLAALLAYLVLRFWSLKLLRRAIGQRR